MPPYDSAYAKLGMISSALSSDSDDVTKLLNVSLDLIAPDKINNKTNNKTNNSTSTRPAAFSAVSVEGLAKNSLSSHSKHGGGLPDSERAVEVLSFLVSKTKVQHRDRQATRTVQDSK